MIYSKILSTGSYLPKRIVSNETLSTQVDTSHAWIVERTGIEQRHIADISETVVFMGAEAAKQALNKAGLKATDIDLIVVATCTPDKVFPSSACLIQASLGVSCAAFDVQAVCSGFIYGLCVVDQFIKTGQAKRALLIGSEAMSRLVDWTDRRTCVLFGDGAGAVILEASDTPGVLCTRLGADGAYQDVLYTNGSGYDGFGRAGTEEASPYIQMQGNLLYKIAVKVLDKALHEILEEQHMTLSEIDWLIPHQANLRMIQTTIEKLGLPMEKVIITLDKQGNTSAASIPLALDWGIEQQKIKRGQRLLLEAIGGGLTWGTALVNYF